MSYLKLELLLYLVFIICVLISVAFLTLFERKGLGYIQIRKGPNKVGFLGILQPFSDAIKLFTKEGVFPTMSNFSGYYLCPILSLFLSLGVWFVFPSFAGWCDNPLGMLFILVFISASVYPIMGSGWFSNSKYALLGSLRSIAQTISYEVCLALIIIVVLLLVMDYDLSNLMIWQEGWCMLMIMMPMSFIWILIMLAETNRTPFDFAEGESELVSGFNVEYGGGGFALIFMAEYSSILFMSFMYSLLFFGGSFYSLGMKITMASFIFIMIRGLLPRFRYDKLMYLAWKSALPVVLNYFLFIFCFAVLM